MLKTISFIVAIMSCYFATSQNVTLKTIHLEAFKYVQNYEHFKRLVLDSPDSHIEYLQNFDFEWGYQYLIQVEEAKVKEPLSDGTQFSYAFKKIVSKTKMADSTIFTLSLDPSRYYYELPPEEEASNHTFSLVNDSTYLYFDEVEIEVPVHLRATFDQMIESKTKKRGHFIVVNGKRIRLICM